MFVVNSVFVSIVGGHQPETASLKPQSPVCLHQDRRKLTDMTQITYFGTRHGSVPGVWVHRGPKKFSVMQFLPLKAHLIGVERPKNSPAPPPLVGHLAERKLQPFFLC